MERTVAAFQHFQGQAPEVQCLLQQFTAIFDATRAADAAADARQPTLEQVFARTSSSSAPVASPPAAGSPLGGIVAQSKQQTQLFDIGSEVSSTAAGLEAIRVDGQNVGDKRKQEHIQDAERISKEEADAKEGKEEVLAVQSVDETPSVEQEGGIEVDVEGISATPVPVQTEAAQKTYTKRTQLLGDLDSQVKNERAAAARQRASPYGHG